MQAYEPDKITIGEILVHYAHTKVKTVSDKQRLLYTLKALSPFWADKKVSEIDVDTCKAYSVQRNCSEWTVRREMGTLNAALKYALSTRKLTYAPIVTLPRKGVAKDRWLTEEEVDLLLGASAPHVQQFIKIAINTGRRKTAITRLRWQPSLDSGWVDMNRGIIHFLGRAEEETKKKRGMVKMPQKLFDEMKTWDQNSSHVISHQGKPVSRIDKAFRAAALRAGLTDVTPHTLKHTAVTWAFMKGMTLELATDYFATSRETLENTYRSYGPEAHKEAASIMDRVLIL
ncbi:hypothetical protein BV911_17970 [Pseudoruegeria sp. SK021]|nr:hypothetical protein BV911_17970 [Pseudoruegeria sp. SK021]